jgi:hypothetical protein
MQWSHEPNGGFSTAERIYPPIVADGPFGYRRVNVHAQRRDPDSLLHRVGALIRTRKECPELGFGAWRLLETDQPGVLAHRADWAGGSVAVLHNLAGTGCQVKIASDRLIASAGTPASGIGSRCGARTVRSQWNPWAVSRGRRMPPGGPIREDLLDPVAVGAGQCLGSWARQMGVRGVVQDEHVPPCR